MADVEESVWRVASYLARRRKDSSAEYELIHSYDKLCESEENLFASDIEAILKIAAREGGQS